MGIMDFVKGQPECIKDQQKSNLLSFQHIPEYYYKYDYRFRLQDEVEMHYLAHSEGTRHEVPSQGSSEPSLPLASSSPDKQFHIDVVRAIPFLENEMDP